MTHVKSLNNENILACTRKLAGYDYLANRAPPQTVSRLVQQVCVLRANNSYEQETEYQTLIIELDGMKEKESDIG